MGGPVVGPSDGVTYVVLNSREETTPAIECGMNDIGAGNPGIFIVETRAYTEYSKGSIMKTWSEDVRTFSKCGPIP
jgi:hypothetical protein